MGTSDLVQAALGLHPELLALLLVAALGLLAVATQAAVRAARRSRLTRTVGVVVLLLSAEGFFELLRGPVGLPVWAALLWAGVIELSVVAMAQLAERAMAAQRWGYAVGVVVTIYVTMATAGLMAAGASGSTAAGAVRVVMPLLGATLWLVDVLFVHVRPSGGRLVWLWSPRRLAVAVGAMAPDGEALEAVAEARRRRVAARQEARQHRDTVRLARLALRHGRGLRPLAVWRAAQLDRLLEAAPAAAVRAAEEQVARAQTARGRLLRPAARAAQPSLLPARSVAPQPPAARAAQPPAARAAQPAEAAPLGQRGGTAELVREVLAVSPELGDTAVARELSARGVTITRQSVAKHRQRLARAAHNGHPGPGGGGEDS